MKNVHVIQTDKPSRLAYLTKKGKEVYKDLRLFEKPMPIILESENQNIYIISNDEKPKTGEWALFQGKIHKCIEDITGDQFKKIILTTNQDLIEDGIQAIDDEFLEWFVKNPTCEFVEVEELGPGFPAGIYFINFLPEHYNYSKEKPKQDEKVWIKESSKWSLGYYIGFDSKNSIYFVRGIIDDENSIGPLLTSSQEVLPYSAMPNEPKKDTIEEAARKYYENNIDRLNIPRKYYEYEIQELMLGFANQWQEQNSDKMYSEEDLINAFFAGVETTGEGWNGEYANGNCPVVRTVFKNDLMVWLNQYKNI
jgi:hypothetical protein